MYREIVTKAVIGKGTINNKNEIELNLGIVPSKILGCWVINHYFVSSVDNDKVYAKGRYDIHFWYGLNNDTDTNIYKESIDYIEEFNIEYKTQEKFSEGTEFVITCSKYPTCENLVLNDDSTVGVSIAKELKLDIIGETKLKVHVDEYKSEEIGDINVDYLRK